MHSSVLGFAGVVFPLEDPLSFLNPQPCPWLTPGSLLPVSQQVFTEHLLCTGPVLCAGDPETMILHELDTKGDHMRHEGMSPQEREVRSAGGGGEGCIFK